MSFTPEQQALLSEKLDKSVVKTRKQANRNLSYIEGWHAIAEANRIFGFGNWSREITYLECVWEGMTTSKEPKPALTYMATVQIKVYGPVGELIATRQGTGAGHGIGGQIGQNHESAAKEAETDAMKRALMTFGNVFGLALYDKEQTNVGEPEPPKMDEEAMTWALDAMSQIKQCSTTDELDACRAGLRDQFTAYAKQPQNKKAADDVKAVMTEHLAVIETNSNSE